MRKLWHRLFGHEKRSKKWLDRFWKRTSHPDAGIGIVCACDDEVHTIYSPPNHRGLTDA